jgi:hypothetical protein
MKSPLLNFGIFLVVAAFFIYNTLLGIRALGLAEAAVGLYWIRTGSVPYGWAGRPPSGYLQGWAAIGCGVLAIALGLLFLMAPKVVEPLFCDHRRCI